MKLEKIHLNNKVDALFNEQFVQYDTEKIPEITDKRLTHGATGFVGDFTFLYVDMRGSSSFTSSHRLQTIAKVYKAFHHCMVEAIKIANGRVRSFDGDRVMGVFSGAGKVDAAVGAALLMIGCKTEILLPKIKSAYGNDAFDIGIGIATGQTLATKAGVGYDVNNHDLVWIGDPPNLGARLSDEAKSPNGIFVCENSFKGLGNANRWTNKAGQRVDMWVPHAITFGKRVLTVYSSSYYRSPS